MVYPSFYYSFEIFGAFEELYLLPVSFTFACLLKGLALVPRFLENLWGVH